LSDKVSNSRPENLPIDLSGDYIDDEVGTLASALEQAMKRVENFVKREHQFTRDASHELRTPVTVIKGAVELLQNQLSSDEKKSVLRPIGRIQRQVNNMERIIDALLCLSREEVSTDNEQSFSVLPLVQDVIEENRPLLAGKSIEMNVVAKGNPTLRVPAPLFQIALTNLIQNAIRYTTNGHITVYVRDDRVLVSDSGSGIEDLDLNNIVQPHVCGSVSNGFGLGLSIVDRLCNRFGWQLEIESDVARGTTAQLIFRCVEK
jgi:signal transduction histidine kinase